MNPAFVFLVIAMSSRTIDKCRISPLNANMRYLTNAVNQFRMDTGRLPTTEEGVNALVVRPSGVQNWQIGGYLETTKVPKDSWGTPFGYLRDPNLPGGFGIYSCGLDGITISDGNDTDDINTWRTNDYYKVVGMPEATRDNHTSRVIVAIVLPMVGIVLWKGFGVARRRREQVPHEPQQSEQST